jgi:dihydrofolate reductase|tara:strand:- start:2490 stop:2996 length:507 start_codon:yes stop_codon:yes gene_type:complete
MIVSIIVAACENNVIGKDNDLIWHLPTDMKFFKDTTKDHHVIMGRKNFESIPHKFRPLPNRTNIIITRNKNYFAKDCVVASSIKEAINIAKNNNDKEPFIIGGGEIYKLALEEDLVDRIYLTKVHHKFEGDTFFPKLGSEWIEKNRVKHDVDEKHRYSFSFLIFEKNN